LQQKGSEILASNIGSMRAAEELEIGLGDVRNQLGRFLLTGEAHFLEGLPPLRAETDRWLAEADRLATTAREQEQMSRVRLGYAHFFAELDQVPRAEPMEEAGRQKLQQLIDDVLTEEILVPTHEYLDFNEEVAARGTADNQAMANWMVAALLVLGTCGPVAGLLAGVGITRRFTHSLVRLSLPLKDAAGKLQEVVGPITLAPGWSLEELEAVLCRLAEQIGAVIERLQQSQRETLRAEQLAAVGQLAAGLAHEVRNPLMSMKILVQAAAAGGDPPTLSRRGLAVLEEEITRLEGLTRSFLEFARPPQPDKRTFDVRTVVAETVQLLSGKAQRRGGRIVWQAPEEPVPLRADKGQMRQLLLNLLLNAVEATPEGGSVRVDLEPPARVEPLPSLSSRESGPRSRCLHIRVADTGPGLPAQLGRDIFKPFVSTKPTGLGLGLSICERIVEAHGGEITAANRPTGGALFTVCLPCG
jgi:signal transduction histidine kinase